ncbi:hypothetical protein DK45_3990 [Bordetella bronchiseptica]|nr:hypothetical protein DK45_3990 [Bordetella bronchiseptica]
MAFFLFWIGPLSLECRSFAVCLCRRLRAENEANNGINGVTTHSLPLLRLAKQEANRNGSGYKNASSGCTRIASCPAD